MSEPFIGEVKIVAFNYAPRGYAQCNGQLLSIAQNTALFALLGTQFGGNGQTTFALPNLHGRVPVHAGFSGTTIGEAAGAESVTLTTAQMPCARSRAWLDAPGDLDHREGQRARRAASTRRRPLHQLGHTRRAQRVGNGRWPTARQHAAVADGELRHRPRGHLPVAELTASLERRDGPIYR